MLKNFKKKKMKNQRYRYRYITILLVTKLFKTVVKTSLTANRCSNRITMWQNNTGRCVRSV